MSSTSELLLIRPPMPKLVPRLTKKLTNLSSLKIKPVIKPRDKFVVQKNLIEYEGKNIFRKKNHKTIVYFLIFLNLFENNV